MIRERRVVLIVWSRTGDARSCEPPVLAGKRVVDRVDFAAFRGLSSGTTRGTESTFSSRACNSFWSVNARLSSL